MFLGFDNPGDYACKGSTVS